MSLSSLQTTSDTLRIVLMSGDDSTAKDRAGLLNRKSKRIPPKIAAALVNVSKKQGFLTVEDPL
jgi:hypothetical protein